MQQIMLQYHNLLIEVDPVLKDEEVLGSNEITFRGDNYVKIVLLPF